MAKQLVILFGLPGTGKTFLAKQLTERLKWPHLNSDGIRFELFPTPEYTPEEKEQVYDELKRRIEELLQDNPGVVVDGTFYKEAIRKKFDSLAASVSWVEVLADEMEVKRRLTKKREDSDADFAVYQALKFEFEPMQEPHQTVISTDKSTGYWIEQIYQHVISEPCHESS